MDPNQTLKDILRLALEAAQTGDKAVQMDMLDKLNQNSMDLRDWIARGGYRPYLFDWEIRNLLFELHIWNMDNSEL